MAAEATPPAHDLAGQRLPAPIVDIVFLAEGRLVADDADFHAVFKASGYLVEDESLGQ